MDWISVLTNQYPWLAWSAVELEQQLKEKLDPAFLDLGIPKPMPINTALLLQEWKRLFQTDWNRVEARSLLIACYRLAEKLPEHQGLRPLGGLILETDLITLASQWQEQQGLDLRPICQRHGARLDEICERYDSWWYTWVSFGKGIWK